MEEEVKLINEVLNCDRYHAEAKINEGSYGQIFRVRDKQTGQVFALKAMELEKLHKMQKAHEAAIEEVILRKLKHQGIIRLQEVIYAPKYIGMVLELCPFGDFFKLMGTINRHMELAMKKRKILLYYLAQVLQAIDYLHSNFIIHRDLKPENIVLGKDLKVRIIDFGTAKVTSSHGPLSQEEIDQINKLREQSDQSMEEKERARERVSFVGTANYLSPQGIDLSYSNKNDIWAFGILAYKFYFNHLPYEGQDSIQIFKKIKLGDLPLEKGVQPEFEEFFRLTLCKDPEQRPSSSQLKKIKLFEGINFGEIFLEAPPITKEELMSQPEPSSPKKAGSFEFQISLEKRMFFGNYKPRLLTIEKVGTRLLMAYRYIPSRKVKNQFELNMNDYAEVIKGSEFQVVTTDNRYHFRLPKGPSEAVVADINDVIRSRYSLS